ncbi:MAG: hypothetical protein ACO3YM_05015 [Candidatus Kapaibacteriota bacterium]
MIRRYAKPACWLIASFCLIYSFIAEGTLNPPFYRSISIVFFIVTLAIHKKDTEISLKVNEERTPMPIEVKELSLDIDSILKSSDGLLSEQFKNISNRGNRIG